jgi:hypothetical protein
LLFHPNDEVSVATANRFVSHFDKLGMRRAGVNVRVPVRFRSEALEANGTLKGIDIEGGVLDVIIVLYGADMSISDKPWMDLCAETEMKFRADGKTLLPIVVQMDASVGRPDVFANLQDVRWSDWIGLTDDERATRLMVHVVNAVRRRVASWPIGQRETIFISHAKRDGRVVAERIVRHISDPSNGLKLDTFYDALELESGEEWIAGLKHYATTGSLIALVTDAYDERPWCNQEILWAKEKRRPIVLVDIGRSRVDRSFPYAGNVPLVRDPLETTGSIEQMLLDVLSEALRCDLFIKTAGGKADILPLPRPPELADLAFFLAEHKGKTLVYPDPPLSNVEIDLLKVLTPTDQRICAIGDL